MKKKKCDTCLHCAMAKMINNGKAAKKTPEAIQRIVATSCSKTQIKLT